jgi:3-methylcrotonyl-CoA carboxylase alpha subunit
MASRRVVVRVGGEDIAVELASADSVTVGGAGGGDAHVAAGTGTGVYRVEMNGRSCRVYVAGTPDHPWLFCDGVVFQAEVRPEGAAARRAPGALESLSAPMPATVVRILAEPGLMVAKGDPLVMLEAMKMELPIRAPHEGRVTRVHCRVGELVQPGAPLVDFE